LLHVANIVYLVSRLLVLYGRSILAKTSMKDEMVFYISIGIIFSFLSIVAGCICVWNFGRGLKPILLGQVQRQVRTSEIEDDYYIQRLNYNIVRNPDRDTQRFALD
jgi:hypothetical protein